MSIPKKVAWVATAVLSSTVLAAPAAFAANETVNVYLTTTSDAGGRTVTRGLQQQSPVAFGSSSGSANQTITVNENTSYQQFEGAGASITDTAAFNIRGSGALSAATQNDVMTKLFSPSAGIGVSAIRNVIGSSDLAQNNFSYDNTCCDVNDFSLARDADVMALTKQAVGLNPAGFVMASPWTAPPWMKDNNAYSQGYLQAQYYKAYAQYFVKYIQGYQAQGVPIRYVTSQNEPGCCPGYPSMQWPVSGLQSFAKNDLMPALQAAGLNTKLLIGDWNFDTYDQWVAPLVADTAIRNHPNFGGIAWHDYGGSPSTASTVRNQYPNVNMYMTEHSGGTWVSNQHAEDMGDLIEYFRNWGRAWTKWSLAVDQNMGPHNGGCGTCTGLITVQRGGSRNGQVDYTIEYYTMGHLTKFVKPGAVRIDSSANSTVSNVAFRNTDGSKALIAYNTSGGAQSVKVNWGGQSFVYNLPARTSATFTWSGAQSGGPAARTGTITGLGGKCLDVTGGSTANGNQPQLWDCTSGNTNQQWTVGADGTIRGLGKCLDVANNSTADGAVVHQWDCIDSVASQKWTVTAGRDIVNNASGKCLDVKDNSTANGAKLQLWACTGAANQKWTAP
ncbi:ricin-type beta-trefoil lectin domain protein [Paractinoplanes lichenicola]|uniref:Ricin-type beta-trefoil lectin domain protein n=1 Tax=Paractinoplanes lichenicola TaxID=2802976 RepID=A0ABS1W456_9ACTN|nr:ricin-type beta-trefoil lectin domain protein [Actinoplanes lichenicola]MBL7261521.1 ricin-type beta-trefoil lectin domain protein [Actinoplanes lichenicola]